MASKGDNEVCFSHDLFSEERGATLLEYGLLLALIALVAVTGVAFVGVQNKETYCQLVRSTAPKWQAPVGGGEGEGPEVDDCGLIYGRWAP